jgi:hypothetical protein
VIHVGRIGLEKNLDFLKRWLLLFCSIIMKLASRKKVEKSSYYTFKINEEIIVDLAIGAFRFYPKKKKNCSLLRALMIGVLLNHAGSWIGCQGLELLLLEMDLTGMLFHMLCELFNKRDS